MAKKMMRFVSCINIKCPVTGCHHGLLVNMCALEASVFANFSQLVSLELLQKRYYYAGGSIRHMLADSLEDDVLRPLNKSLAKVVDYSTLLKDLSGDSQDTSVNTLMQWFKGDSSIPLSNYVTRRLVDKATIDFVSEAKKLMPDNGSYQG